MSAMESFVNRLRNTISSTAAVTATTINSVLPGNAVTREFEVVAHQCSAGPGLLWKVYSGFKKSTKAEASIFVFEKKQLDPLPKRDRELVQELLRKGVRDLTRLRHPSLLVVQHPLEESRDSLAFATEPVIASVANLMGQFHNLPTPVPREIDCGDLYEIEIRYGLLSIAEGIAFVHNEAKILHRNICPESIIVSKRGSWKLAGFEFSCSPIAPNDFPLKFPTLNVTNQTVDYPAFALPHLDYLAPEYVTRTSDQSTDVTLCSDMYSLGALTYVLYNKGKALLPTGGSRSSFNADRVNQIANLTSNSLFCIPEESRHHIRSLLNVDPTMRPDAHQFGQISIFDDVLIRTLQFLDSSFQWDNVEKCKFYKGLPEIMMRMPLRVKINRVIPCLSRELVISEMVPFVLPSLMQIAEEMSETEFNDHLVNELKPVFGIMQPIQVPIFMLQRLELIISKSRNKCPDLIRNEILNLMCRSLDAISGSSETATNVIQLQELCLQTIPLAAPLLDMISIKNQLLPKVKKLCLSTSTLSVRVNCLVTIAKVMEQLDKWSVLDEIIPFLSEVPCREPAVIMACVGIIQIAVCKPKLGLTKEVMANKVIPLLMPLSIENSLSVSQFQKVMSLIKELIGKIETEQRAKVEQMSEMRAQQSVAVISYNPVAQASKDVNGFSKLTLNPAKSSEDTSNATPLVKPETKSMPSKTKDLTSSLINSNIMSMSSHVQNPSSSLQTYGKPLTGTAPSASVTPSPYVPVMSDPNQMIRVQAAPTLGTRPAVSNSSAFDSIMLPDLPGKSSGSKVSMNSMKQSAASHSFSVMTPAAPVTKPLPTTASKLSKSDLEEFLK